MGTVRFAFSVADLSRHPRKAQLVGPIELAKAFDRAAKPPRHRPAKIRPVFDPLAAGLGRWKSWADR